MAQVSSQDLSTSDRTAKSAKVQLHHTLNEITVT